MIGPVLSREVPALFFAGIIQDQPTKALNMLKPGTFFVLFRCI